MDSNRQKAQNVFEEILGDWQKSSGTVLERAISIRSTIESLSGSTLVDHHAYATRTWWMFHGGVMESRFLHQGFAQDNRALLSCLAEGPYSYYIHVPNKDRMIGELTTVMLNYPNRLALVLPAPVNYVSPNPARVAGAEQTIDMITYMLDKGVRRVGRPTNSYVVLSSLDVIMSLTSDYGRKRKAGRPRSVTSMSEDEILSTMRKPRPTLSPPPAVAGGPFAAIVKEAPTVAAAPVAKEPTYTILTDLTERVEAFFAAVEEAKVKDDEAGGTDNVDAFAAEYLELVEEANEDGKQELASEIGKRWDYFMGF